MVGGVRIWFVFLYIISVKLTQVLNRCLKVTVKKNTTLLYSLSIKALDDWRLFLRDHQFDAIIVLITRCLCWK